MLYGMNVKVFGKILPPNGAFTFYLFGNPDASGGANSLGWYGAYLRNPDKKQGSQQRSLPRQPALPRVPNLRQHAGLLSLGAEALSLQNRRVYSGKILKTLSPKN
jgi:hypothetical protein